MLAIKAAPCGQCSLPLVNGIVAQLPFTIAPGVFQNLRLTLTNVILSTAAAFPAGSTNRSGGVAISQVFLAPDKTADGFLNVIPDGLNEQCFVIEASSDLTNWVRIATNNFVGSLLQFVDPLAKNYPYRFYRGANCHTNFQASPP